MPGSPQKRARRAAAAAAAEAQAERRRPEPTEQDEPAEPKRRRYPAGSQGRPPWVPEYEHQDGPPPHADNHNGDNERSRRPKVRCAHVTVGTERQCRGWAIKGSDPPRCRTHGTKRERDRAMIAHEVRQWRLGDTHVDPAEMLLRLVSQSAARLDKLSTELAELVDEEGLRAALIGEVRVPTEAGSYVSGDYVRGLARLEGEERDRLAHFAKTALAAGLETRRVELAESQGRLMAAVLRQVFGDPTLGLSPEQLALVPGLLRRAQEAVLAPGHVPDTEDAAPREIEAVPVGGDP